MNSKSRNICIKLFFIIASVTTLSVTPRKNWVLLEIWVVSFCLVSFFVVGLGWVGFFGWLGFGALVWFGLVFF